MAMLAEPRRKQKVINLRAKNSAWSNDSSKFGQRMLEKMGWTSGKGLGANENGIVEHVVARYKNDEKGLGFEDRNDQWTKHEDDFDSLLANLSKDENKDKLHSGVSLEAKSKKSKARIHYHKFTRGKDLSRYSEKDLANIFGKKSFKKEPEQTEIAEKEDVTTSETVFTEKGSMEDYFKNKIAAFKKKNKDSSAQIINRTYSADDKDSAFEFQGFSQLADDGKGFGFQPFSQSIEEVNENEASIQPDEKTSEKKSKKKKGFKYQNDNDKPSIGEELGFENFSQNIEAVENELLVQNEEDNSGKKIRKKKKSKHHNAEPEDSNSEVLSSKVELPLCHENSNDLHKKHKKDKKSKKNELLKETLVSNVEDKRSPVKKRLEKKDTSEENEMYVLQENNQECVPVMKKLKKKRNFEENQSLLTPNEAIEESYIPKIKKKKKCKPVEN